MLTGGEPWVLGTYTEQTRTEGGVTARAEFCFDPATGFLRRTRTLKAGVGQGPEDLVAVFTQTGGNLTREEYFGGDQQAGQPTLGTGELCGLDLPANQYRIDHTWQYGAGSQSRYYDAAGVALSFKSLDTDIDQQSGLVRKSRDTSLIGTSYEYDAMGRLTAVKAGLGSRRLDDLHLQPIARTDLAGAGPGLTPTERRGECAGRIDREVRLLRPSLAGAHPDGGRNLVDPPDELQPSALGRPRSPSRATPRRRRSTSITTRSAGPEPSALRTARATMSPSPTRECAR